VKIATRKFGEIEIEAGKILMMPEGLPGFPGFEKFVLIEDSKTKPFCWFQSVEEPNLALVVMSPFVFKPDYRIDLNDLVKSRNWTVGKEGLLIYVVVNVSVRDKVKTVTANLMGPLIINPSTNEVIQFIISDTSYSHQYVVIESPAG
jgi:flagellar assembly factor FliW